MPIINGPCEDCFSKAIYDDDELVYDLPKYMQSTNCHRCSPGMYYGYEKWDFQELCKKATKYFPSFQIPVYPERRTNMFKGEKIGIADINGKDLKCGDIVKTIYEHDFDEIDVEGTIVYDQNSAMFMIEFPSVSIAVAKFIEAGMEYVRPDAEYLANA